MYGGRASRGRKPAERGPMRRTTLLSLLAATRAELEELSPQKTEIRSGAEWASSVPSRAYRA